MISPWHLSLSFSHLWQVKRSCHVGLLHPPVTPLPPPLPPPCRLDLWPLGAMGGATWRPPLSPGAGPTDGPSLCGRGRPPLPADLGPGGDVTRQDGPSPGFPGLPPPDRPPGLPLSHTHSQPQQTAAYGGGAGGGARESDRLWLALSGHLWQKVTFTIMEASWC